MAGCQREDDERSLQPRLYEGKRLISPAASRSARPAITATRTALLASNTLSEAVKEVSWTCDRYFHNAGRTATGAFSFAVSATELNFDFRACNAGLFFKAA